MKSKYPGYKCCHLATMRLLGARVCTAAIYWGNEDTLVPLIHMLNHSSLSFTIYNTPSLHDVYYPQKKVWKDNEIQEVLVIRADTGVEVL